MKNTKLFYVVFILTMLFSLNIPKQTGATTFSTSFEPSEGYNLGTLGGQNGWVGDGVFKISDSNPSSGTQSIISSDGNITWKSIDKGFSSPQTSGDIVFYVGKKYNDRFAALYQINLNSGGSQLTGGSQVIRVVLSSYDSHIHFITKNSIGTSVDTDLGTFLPDTYYKVRVKWDIDSATAYTSINDGAFVASPIPPQNLDTIEIQFRSSDSVDSIYFDDLQDLSQDNLTPQITDLISILQNLDLKSEFKNSLEAKLQNAQALLNNTHNTLTVCNLLAAFVHETNAQIGHAMTSEQASQLTVQVIEVENSLGCR